MSDAIIQPSFAAGELSPSLYSRVDLAKFHVGVARAENFFIDYRGGMSNRPGTAFTGRTLAQTGKVRLFPFTFSTLQTYVLEMGSLPIPAPINVTGAATSGIVFGWVRLQITATATLVDGCRVTVAGVTGTTEANGTWYCRVVDGTHIDLVGSVFVNAYAAGGTVNGDTGYLRIITGGGYVLEASQSITSISQANPGVVGKVAHGYINGDWIYIVTAFDVGAAKMVQLVGQTFIAAGVTANTFQLTDLNGNPVDTSPYPLFASGTMARIYTVKTPYWQGDLLLLKYAQNADTMTLVNNNYEPRNLTRTGNAAWTLTSVAFQNPPGPNAPFTVTPSTAGTTGYHFQVTALYSNGSESTPAAVGQGNSVQMSNTAGARITVSWAVPNVSPPTGMTLIGYNIYCTLEIPGSTGPDINSHGLIGFTTATTFIDTNILPDFTLGPAAGAFPFYPPSHFFPGAGHFPGVVSYFQGRRVYAAAGDAPETFWMSKSGDYANLSYSSPARPDDAIEETIANAQVNNIKALVPVNSLLALTASGANRIDAGPNGGPVGPGNIEAPPQAYNGCSDVPPITVNYDILYVQNKGSIVRDLSYNLYVNLYTGNDVTVLSNHLFIGHQIVEWDFAEEPFKIVWAVREDGVLLSFTYLKEQDIYAWAHHITAGQFKSVATVQEGNEDAVYFVVSRFLQGKWIMNVERMASRVLGANPELGVPADLSKAWFVDCGLQFPLIYPQATATPSLAYPFFPPLNPQGECWVANVIIQGVNYSAPVFTIVNPDGSTGTGAILTPTISGGKIMSVSVDAGGHGYKKGATVKITDSTGSGAEINLWVIYPMVINTDVPVFNVSTDASKTLRINGGIGTCISVNSTTQIACDMLQLVSNIYPAPPGTWSLTANITTISGLQPLEGQTVAILADGNVQPSQTVVNGAVTIPQAASAITIGLPYTAIAESLYLDIPGENPTPQGKRKKIAAVTLRVQDTRGLKIGQIVPGQVPQLTEFKERDYQLMGNPIQLITADERVIVDAAYTENTQVRIQQDYPLPATVTAFIPEVTIGDT